MRALALILPMALLGLLALIFIGDPPPDARERPEPESASFEESAEAGIVWVSHDWVEVSPAVHEERKALRRETFGLDRAVAEAECFDPNCRACLIDLVYGREF